MAIALAPQFTQRSYRWTDWKAVQYSKNLVTQYDDNEIIYTIWGYDGPEVHICTIWKGTVPDGVKASYSQEQNDSDKSDFETNFKPSANQPVIPMASDGRANFLPNIFPTNTQLIITGAGDDPTNGLGAGTGFSHSSDDVSATDHIITFNFNDCIYLSGGHIIYAGAVLGDIVNYEVLAPATSTTSTPGTGNCNLAGPGNVLITPAAGNGSNTVDLTVAKPVPNTSGTGFYDLAQTTTGPGTITANANQTGLYDLYTVDVTLGRLVVNYPMLNSNALDLTVPAIAPMKLLPQWQHKVTVHNSGHTGLKLVWSLILSRFKAT